MTNAVRGGAFPLKQNRAYHSHVCPILRFIVARAGPGDVLTDGVDGLLVPPEDVDAFAAWAGEEGLSIVGVDNLPGAVPLESTPLPRDTVLLFGQEGPGLTDEAARVCELMVAIAQFGSTRSINAGAAAAIAMHAWIREHADLSSVEY